MTTTLRITHNKEMRALINKIKNYGLNNNGIIFGGLVRSDIIGGHFRKEYFKKNDDTSRYWDINYDIETKYRTIIPKDLDIYFKNENDYNSFIITLNNMTKMLNGYIEIKKNNSNIRYLFNNNSLNHFKVTIEFRIGKTISYSGIKLTFSIDVIYNKNNTEHSIEPPFYNLDFLSNIFLMEQTNNSIIIRLSNCSGTPIDDMNYIDKSRISTKIMNDIIQHKTQFTRNISNYNTENINCYRIIKMIEYGWNITNIPFNIIYINDFDKNDDSLNDKCCICLEKLKDEENEINKIFQINTNKIKDYKVHYTCFINYLKIEQRKNNLNPITGENECKCPYRMPFNFKDCYKLISYD